MWVKPLILELPRRKTTFDNFRSSGEGVTGDGYVSLQPDDVNECAVNLIPRRKTNKVNSIIEIWMIMFLFKTGDFQAPWLVIGSTHGSIMTF